MGEVSVKELKLIYENADGKRTVALDGLTATFPQEKLSVIVGGSGSGKTTLLRVIAGLVQGTGSVAIEGQTVDDMPVNKRDIAYVTQEFVMYPGMTVFDNIAFPLKQKRLKPDNIIRLVYDISEKLGIAFLLSRKPRELSLGQQQLVSLARALVRSPRVILLDEPFSHLDPEKRSGLKTVIRSCAKNDKITVIYVTHSIREAMSSADRLFVMQNGRMICEGAPQEVYDSALPEVRQLISAELADPCYGRSVFEAPESSGSVQSEGGE